MTHIVLDAMQNTLLDQSQDLEALLLLNEADIRQAIEVMGQEGRRAIFQQLNAQLCWTQIIALEKRQGNEPTAQVDTNEVVQVVEINAARKFELLLSLLNNEMAA